jgi:hypothetical protein
MTEKHASASSRSSRISQATLRQFYEAFTDPAALVEWLPPGDMTGTMHEQLQRQLNSFRTDQSETNGSIGSGVNDTPFFGNCASTARDKDQCLFI